MSDARWDDPREYDTRNRGDEWPRVYDPRDGHEHDPREALMRDLDLPRGDERELVVDRERVYELDGDDSRTLAAVGSFRIVPEHDLDLPHDTLRTFTTRGSSIWLKHWDGVHPPRFHFDGNRRARDDSTFGSALVCRLAGRSANQQTPQA